jgi:hypothetical protein
VLLRLLNSCQLQPGGYGLVSGAQPSGRAVNSRSGIDSLGREATTKDYGVVVARPQGQSRVPNPSTEQQ